MPFTSIPSRADTSHCLNWVIYPRICFIAHEGDSVELRDGESYFLGEERRLLLSSHHFSEHRGGSSGAGGGVTGPKMCSYSSTS